MKCFTYPVTRRLLCTIATASSIVISGHFLTDVTDPLYSSFKVSPDRSFDISVATENYETDSHLSPGMTRNYDPYIINKGNYDVYVFMEVTIPDNCFSLTDMDDNWYPVVSDGNRTIYAYGSESSMTTLKRRGKDFTYTPMLCSGVRLSDNVCNNATKNNQIIARGYAIEADQIDDNNPITVWQILEKNL